MIVYSHRPNEMTAGQLVSMLRGKATNVRSRADAFADHEKLTRMRFVSLCGIQRLDIRLIGFVTTMVL